MGLFMVISVFIGWGLGWLFLGWIWSKFLDFLNMF